MAQIRSGVVEVTWKHEQRVDAGSACEVIAALLQTSETKRVEYQRPSDCVAPDVKVLIGASQGCHHAFVRVVLERGDFGEYADSLQTRARSHESVATAVWRRRQALVVRGTVRLGRVCLGVRPLDE